MITNKDFKPTYIQMSEILEDYNKLSEHEKDILCFKRSEYDGMEFERLDEWTDYDVINYASPRFKFENGDIVAFNKYGKIVKV